MKEIIASKNVTIPLGIQGEKNATKIKFPISDIFKDYEDQLDTTYKLVVQRAGETSTYTADTSTEGDNYSEKYVVWTPSEEDLSKIGTGYCEVQMSGDEFLAKSSVYTTNVVKALEDSSL